MKKRGVMLVRFSLALAAVCVAELLLTTRSALAWGPGTHMYTGHQVLDNLSLLAPYVAEALRRCPRSFLYGCLSPDILIGKSYLRRSAISHSWEVGSRLTSLAKNQSQSAYACGYLAHLAADTVAHNLYVPSALSATKRRGRLSHIYWELRFEHYIDESHYREAEDLLRADNEQHDLLLQQVLAASPMPFQAKKNILLGSVRLHELRGWRRSLALVASNSRWQLDPDAVSWLKGLAVEAAVAFLREPNEARCRRLHPMGVR
ncbi:MAG: zinc dependent phospholipase C family protein [Pseudomonadota bacterium]